MRLRALRAVSLAERSLGMQLVQFEMDQPGQVTFEAWLEVTNAGLDVVQIQPSLGRLADRRVWQAAGRSPARPSCDWTVACSSRLARCT